MKPLAAALILIASISAAPAVELDRLLEIDGDRLGQIYHVLPDEAAEFIADRTFRISLAEIDPRLAATLPFGSDAILYFAANGDLLAWSAKSELVEAGYWEILVPGAFNELCVRFGKLGLISICSSPQIANSDWLKQRVRGNPFGLESGKPVPTAYGEGERLIEDIAADFP